MIMFVIAWMISLFVGMITLAGWWSLAVLAGLAVPTQEQATAVLIGWMALSQIGAAGLMLYLFVWE